MKQARSPSTLAPRGLFLAVLVATPVACRIAPPSVSPEDDVAIASGIAGAVRFQLEGGPLDVASGTSESLTLADALRAAVATDPGLQAALARVHAARAEADLAGRPPDPILDFVLRFPEGGGATELEAGWSMDLIALLQRPLRAGAAGHRLERESALALGTALDVVATVQQRYADVQSLEELAHALEQRVALIERLRALASARLELGEGAQHEVTAIDSEAAGLALTLGRRRRELWIARLELARAIGEPSGAARWALEPWSPPAPVPADEERWIEQALAARPELVAIEWEIRAREDEEALAGNAWLTGSSVSIDAERDGDWSVGPGLALPIPIFGAGGARRELARVLTAEERHRRTEAQRLAVLEVRTSLAALLGAEVDLERLRGVLLPLQERRREQAEAAQRLGELDASAVLLAEDALQEVLVQRVELEREVSDAQVRLERAVGGPSAFQSVLRSGAEVQP